MEIKVLTPEIVSDTTRQEIDIQIATAKNYPRDVAHVMDSVVTLAGLDDSIADECFYTLARQGKEISGNSIRLAEMFASTWGNLRYAARVVANDGQKITAQGICYDLEANVSATKEVSVSIVYSKGGTYSIDMQTVAGNAACSKAVRNAIFSIIPAAIVKSVAAKIKEEAAARMDAKKLKASKESMVKHIAKLGVPIEAVLKFTNAESLESMDSTQFMGLRGALAAISRGESTIKEVFGIEEESQEEKVAAKRAKMSAKKEML